MTRKVLCIVAGSEGYGVRRVWTSLLSALERDGWQVTIAVLERRRAAEWAADFPNIAVVAPEHSVRFGAAPLEPISRYFAMLRRVVAQVPMISWLKHVAKDKGAECILFQGPLESALAGVVARLCGLRAYWFVPNVADTTKPFDLNRRIYRTMFNYANVVPVYNSHYTGATFGTGNFERHVIHLGVDIDYYKPGYDPTIVRKQFSIPSDAQLIGLFARMTSTKGQLRLVEALANSQTDFHILFCGGPTEGPYFEMLKKCISSLGLENRVHVAGSQTDLRPHYAACDIIANLLDGAEGFGLTLVEAMACAKPVFAHAAGGPGETVKDGETGWLIQDSKVCDISGGLKRIESDRARWGEMGGRARENAVAHFSERQFQSKSLALLASAQELTSRP